MNMKVHAITDRIRRVIRFFITAGQVSDYTGAIAMVTSLPADDWLLGDRGYDANWFREALVDKGITPCIPGRKSQDKAVKHDKRRIAIRYDCRPKVFLSAIALAATVLFWCKSMCLEPKPVDTVVARISSSFFNGTFRKSKKYFGRKAQINVPTCINGSLNSSACQVAFLLEGQMKSMCVIKLHLKLPLFAAAFGSLTTQATGHGTFPGAIDGSLQQNHPAHLSLPKTKGFSASGFGTRTVPWADQKIPAVIQHCSFRAADRPGLANV